MASTNNSSKDNNRATPNVGTASPGGNDQITAHSSYAYKCKKNRRRIRAASVALPMLTHALSIALYLRPLTSSPHLLSNPPPVLDEAHIVSDGNADVGGTSSLSDVFRNDYWGRPMSSPSSHKSWRPLAVLSFRWLKGANMFGWNDLFVHRLINVLLHAATAETCSIVATMIFPNLDAMHTLILRTATKLLFALHPAHVEVVANAANRPHILAVLMSSIMLDPSNHLLLVVVAQIAGLLSSETAIFQLPAVLATMTVIAWKRRTATPTPTPTTIRRGTFQSFLSTMVELVPRYFIMIALGLSYLIGRKYFDTLSIPDGLIRNAENPFYSLTGQTRVLTYALLLAIHFGKAILIDPIGFSHEYGFECIRNVVEPTDIRLLAPFAVYVVVGLVTLLCNRKGLEPTLAWAVALAWMLTLFPVSGFIKVGTSIADRIVVASTFAFAIFVGRFLSYFLLDFGNILVGEGREHRRPRRLFILVPKVLAVLALFAALSARTNRRSLEWMDSLTLLESSLVSCPRSAKSNLEISKIYSGLYKEKFDLGKAISFLEKAESIDPSYCDVHQQFAHCHIQQGKYLEFEERLTHAVLCPFTMGQSVPLWQRYWKQVTSDPRTGEQAKRRMDKYQAIVNEAIRQEAEREKAQQVAASSSGATNSDEL